MDGKKRMSPLLDCSDRIGGRTWAFLNLDISPLLALKYIAGQSKVQRKSEWAFKWSTG